jgi:hypothetical protein
MMVLENYEACSLYQTKVSADHILKQSSTGMYSFIIKEDKNNLASTKLCVVRYSDRKFITTVTPIYWTGTLYGTVVLMHTCTSNF